jgi:hypothetical protein
MKIVLFVKTETVLAFSVCQDITLIRIPIVSLAHHTAMNVQISQAIAWTAHTVSSGMLLTLPVPTVPSIVQIA